MALGFHMGGSMASAPSIPDGKTVTPINDVTIWQQCAGIANPTLTTLSDVLADSGVLSTLISDNNASDYLARSTSFTTTVCANQNAMTYIGANNYCADALLNDSTWKTAIVGSTYWTSVINGSIPAMTSDTTPSGKVTYSSQGASSGYYAGFSAFNGNDEIGWRPNTYTAGQWVAYQFDAPCKVLKMRVATKYWDSVTFSLSGSNDGLSYTNIKSFTPTRDTTHNMETKVSNYTLTSENNNFYSYYKFTITSGNMYNDSVGVSFQLYGRKDV